MADIALLVVEEFERSRNLEKGDGLKQVVGFDYLASSTLSHLKEAVGEQLSSMKEFGVREMALASRALEPKSSFALAAVDGFFSA